MAIKLDEARIRRLSTNGTTTIAGGHVYLTGSSAGSSTGNTTQLVFGTSSNNHVVLSSNDKALVLNPTTSSTTNQIVLYLNQKSKFPSGIDAGSGGITTAGAISATGNISGNYIQGAWLYTSAATALTTTSKIAVIHSDNYIYYITPANLTTLIKNNASGTWSISVSGNAATSTAATKLSSNNSFALGEHRFQYFNINGTAGAAKEVNDTPTTAWWHIMRLTHANTTGYYTDVAIPFNDNSIYYKRIKAGVVQDWVKVLDSLNYSSYALPITGGTLTSSLTIANGADLYLKAGSSNTTDSGDLVFINNDGTENMRIYGAGNIRFSASGPTQTLLHSGNYNNYAPSKTGSGASGNWGINITGSAAKLTTPRAINGTNFDGSAAITTAYWGTARNFTIGNTTKSVNGSSAMSWSFKEIGLSKDYTSFGTASSNSWGWYTIATISDASTSPALFFVRGYAHTSIIFTVTKGYSTSGSLNILDYNNTANQDYAAVTGARLMSDGRVQIYIRTKKTTNTSQNAYMDLSINVINSGNNITLASSLVADDTTSPSVIVTRNCTITGGMIAAAFDGNATSATVAATLGKSGGTTGPMKFYWSGQSGQPSWLWGGSDGTNMYVYNPSNFNVNYANSAGSVAWGNVTGKPSTFTPSSHTHNYAGSSSAGGAANSANVLNINNTASLSDCLQYIQTSSQTSGKDLPTSAWWHVLKMNHGKGDTYYKRLLAFDFFTHKIKTSYAAGDGTVNAWKTVWVEGDSVTGAVWNDYAEYRESDCKEFGRVLAEKGDDTLTKTTKRLQPFAGVSSDTWGFCQGETEKAKTPIAVAGRVLVYTWRNRNDYKPGDAVCAAPNGTVDIMTRKEIIKYPDRIVGTVSCVPEYETWGSGDRDPVKVGNRIWIKVN